MKIALIRYKYTPFGGAERYMARLIEHLLLRGHEVHVLAVDWESAPGSQLRLHRIPVLKRPGWLRSLAFSLGCRKVIAREKFDIVFSLERTLQQDVYRAGDGCHRMWLRQKNLGRGILAKAFTYLSPIQLSYLQLERRLYTDPVLKAIIANSEMGKAEIVKLYGVAPDKITVVHNGINADAFPVAERERYRAELAQRYNLGEELRILYVGSGFKRKGVPALIETAAKLRIPFRLFIVGKGSTRKLQRRARQLGVEERVVFTGPVRDVERYYLGCDIFAFPTLYDPFSNATLEAMACGLPVVTTPFNGVAELITDGSEGCIVRNPLDAGEIAGAIGKLAEEGVRLRMGAQAARAVAPLTMERNTQETLAVIESVLQGR